MNYVVARFKFPKKEHKPVVSQAVLPGAPTETYYEALSRTLKTVKRRTNKTISKEIALKNKRAAEAAAKLEKPKKIRKIIV